MRLYTALNYGLVPDVLRSNNNVQVDTMFIQGRLVVPLVYETTHFSSAAIFRNQSMADIWSTI